MSAGRWNMVAAAIDATLVRAGLNGRLDERSYPGGVSRSITVSLPMPGWSVEVHDKWWSKNADVWIGYEVVIIDADSIVARAWPLTKKRAEVRDSVAEAVAEFVAVAS